MAWRFAVENLKPGSYSLTASKQGSWLTPVISPTLDQSNTNIAGHGTVLRPDCVRNWIPAHQTTADYFNIGAFAPTPPGMGRIGNCGLGVREGPGTIAVNAGVAKVIPIGESVRMRFEARFTNVLNHMPRPRQMLALPRPSAYFSPRRPVMPAIARVKRRYGWTFDVIAAQTWLQFGVFLTCV